MEKKTIKFVDTYFKNPHDKYSTEIWCKTFVILKRYLCVTNKRKHFKKN